MQVPMPSVQEAATGDTLLVPADGEPLQCHSQLLAIASPHVLAGAVHLAEANAGQSRPLRVPLPDVSHREATLLSAAIYSHDLPGMLACLRAGPELQELTAVAHRLGCTAVLSAVDAAFVRKSAGDGAWLTSVNALETLVWAKSKGLVKLYRRAAQYVASLQQEVRLEGSEDDASLEHLVAVLQSVREPGAAKRPRTS